MEKVYVALGSNRGNREALLRHARQAIQNLPGVEVTGRSSILQTDPVGKTDQPRFLNSVVELTSSLTPHELLAALQGIERDLGRDRGERWGPRTIDLDILLFGHRTIDTPALGIPHPRMFERVFVLDSLCELAPDLRPPGHQQTLRELRQTLLEEKAVS